MAACPVTSLRRCVRSVCTQRDDVGEWKKGPWMRNVRGWACTKSVRSLHERILRTSTRARICFFKMVLFVF